MKTRLPVREAILKRRTYEAPAEGRAGKIRLDFNENTSGCSPAVIRALPKLTPRQIAMYPEYARPSGRIARHFGVRGDELLLTNGGDDALRVFFDAFVSEGSGVLFCEPTFPMYRYYAEIYGARIDVLRYDSEMNFPLQAVLAALKRRPRVFFLANPNNPTGTLVPLRNLRKILEAATHTAVVLDEAYAEFSGLTAIAWIRHFPQLFITRTFSKAAGLAALRLGAVIACKESLSILRRAMPPFPVNIAALVAAETALREGKTIRKYVRETLRLRGWFAGELKKLGIETFSSGGNFLLANFGPSGPPLFAHLARQGILLRERTREIGPGYVRITIGTAREMQTVLKEIQLHWVKC
ncbi:MAG TPA: histidinol-phosphate transaminase [Candidatus Sulfotelmatobacter sp.]|nr:histidinol-phosphate transaminase [Candidatus Sulfotelmatobacter sp.]HUI75532.1 histidinol-phosphate transaminase [Candidatus Acidoferrum sp.]